MKDREVKNETKDWLLVGSEAALCVFISYVLYNVKKPVNPFVGTLILEALGYIDVLSRL